MSTLSLLGTPRTRSTQLINIPITMSNNNILLMARRTSSLNTTRLVVKGDNSTAVVCTTPRGAAGGRSRMSSTPGVKDKGPKRVLQVQQRQRRTTPVAEGGGGEGRFIHPDRRLCNTNRRPRVSRRLPCMRRG